ncbi:hypothetical protein EBT16_10330, partial [bacterium]|nr:hypothetical protein [bacterium]
LNLIRAGTLTRKWLLQGGVPSEIPEGMAREWKELAQRTRDHFQSDHYADIPIDLFSWALRNIDPTGNLALLAPDLVRICQRLTRDSEPHRGLHISGFLPFLDQSETLGDDFYQAGKQFSKESWEITYREALRDPKLKKVALKGPMLFFSGTHTNKDKPFRQLDQKLRWSQVVSGLIKRKLITKVFEAFEREPKDGLIPYTKSNEEGLREPIDLAYAFLRFVAVGKQGSGKKEGAEETEVQIPNQVIVKPGALSKVMGLIGDKWFPDGDGDGSLNAEEFFSVVQVYEDIQERAVQGSYAMAAQRYLDFHTFGNRSSLDGVSSTDDLFVRREIISKVAEVFSFNSYFLEKALIELEEKKRESLFHSLFPINYEAQPVEVFKRIYSENTPKPELLTFLLKREDFMAPAAILTMMDRLLIRCDKNENAVFEWSELSCVAPLLLEAGNQTVESSLIDLDPGVNDASRFLLKFLQIKGVPFLLGRIALVTGSIRDISPSADILALTRGVEDSLQTDWNQIARFIGWDGTEKNRSVWIQEAKKEFGACDLDNNGLIKNEAEWQCFEKAVLGSLIDTATDLLEASGGNLNAKQVLEAMVQSPVVKLAIRLSTQGEGRV